MPLTEKGSEIMGSMKKEYGEKKGESVFYASKNAGTISGVDEIARATQISEGPGLDAVMNWGGGVNAETVLPGGAGDPSKFNRGAAKATGIGATADEWSDEARKAAAEARRTGSGGRGTKAPKTDYEKEYAAATPEKRKEMRAETVKRQQAANQRETERAYSHARNEKE